MTPTDHDSRPGRFACVGPDGEPGPPGADRHTLYLLLAMALVHDAWGVSRARREQVEAYAEAVPGRAFQDYLGHNVGALLVAPDGAILDFAMNRNVALNSTLEHAEYRAIRRAIDGANGRAGPGGVAPWSFGSLLQGHSVYATLEPCAQCSGILDLARVSDVVYAQDDPGQCRVAHMLHALRRGPGVLPAPRPLRASFFPFWRPLAEAYDAYLARLPPGGRAGVTSFLETVPAFTVFADAAAAFDALTAEACGDAALLAAARLFRARRPSDPVESLLGP